MARLAEGAGTSTVYSIDADTVRETAGGLENVLQTLRVLPGVAGTDDEHGRLAVRGSGPEHNVVLLDGVQIHNPYRFGEFTSSFINPATVARVSLDASGLDAGHGGRLSSVTIIETRDGTRDRELAVSGSLGLAAGDVLLEGRLPNTESGAWWATARGTYYRALMGPFRRRKHAQLWRRAVQGLGQAEPADQADGLRTRRTRRAECRRDRRRGTRAEFRASRARTDWGS